MTTQCDECVKAFLRGAIGASVRNIRIEGVVIERAHAMLVARGFLYRRQPLGAERGARGEAKWQRRDGVATPDDKDPSLVLVDVYVHPDAGMVRIFPMGDPRRRLTPEAGTPWAIKSVLFRPAPRLCADDGWDVSFSNEAFRVTEDGRPVQKSRRAAYGIAQAAEHKWLATLAATELHELAEFMAKASVIRLSVAERGPVL